MKYGYKDNPIGVVTDWGMVENLRVRYEKKIKKELKKERITAKIRLEYFYYQVTDFPYDDIWDVLVHFKVIIDENEFDRIHGIVVYWKGRLKNGKWETTDSFEDEEKSILKTMTVIDEIIHDISVRKNRKEANENYDKIMEYQRKKGWGVK